MGEMLEITYLELDGIFTDFSESEILWTRMVYNTWYIVDIIRIHR